MNEVDTANEMAIALGLASFQAQALEYSLVSLHAVSSIGSGKISIRSLMDARYKQTLGKLINDAFSDLKIPNHIQEDLKEALEKRNWVTHHFFREYGCAGFSPEIQRKATRELAACWQMFERMSDQITDLIFKRYEELGRSAEEVRVGAQRAIEEYVKENEV
jgi:hypothetical protein